MYKCPSYSVVKLCCSITRGPVLRTPYREGFSRLICARAKRGLWPKEKQKQICPDARVEYAIRGYCKNAGQTEFGL